MAKVAKKVAINCGFDGSAFIRVQREVSQHSELRRPLVGQLEKMLGAKIVTLFTSFGLENVIIDDSDAEMLESLLAAEPPPGKLILIINSPGGDALAAERIVNVCRAYSNGDFEVLVPHMAKSAATMICFGSNLIHMSTTAELGPVDPQVWFVDQELQGARQISAAEYVRSYLKLMKDAAKANKMEPYLLQLSKFDARYVEKLISAQKLSADISVRLLQATMLKGMSRAKIRRSIGVFLEQAKTQSHGRMITLGGAEACGLKIKKIDVRSSLWEVVWELFVRSDWAADRYGKVMDTSLSGIQTSIRNQH